MGDSLSLSLPLGVHALKLHSTDMVLQYTGAMELERAMWVPYMQDTPPSLRGLNGKTLT